MNTLFMPPASLTLVDAGVEVAPFLAASPLCSACMCTLVTESSKSPLLGVRDSSLDRDICPAADISSELVPGKASSPSAAQEPH